MPYDTPSSDSVAALVADARAKARGAARLIRRIDPWRSDPRVACAADICNVLEGPLLFEVDTVGAIEALADNLHEQLAAGEASGVRLQSLGSVHRLHTALVETAAAARRLEDVG